MTIESLWAFGRYDLGLTDADFWALTPRQYAELMERRREDLHRQDLRIGVLCALVANLLGGDKSKVFEPEDFCITPKKGAPPARAQTPEDMLIIVELLNAAHGGKDLRQRN